MELFSIAVMFFYYRPIDVIYIYDKIITYAI